MTKVFLISVSGENRSGIMSSLTHVFSHYSAEILDIGQAVIHETLSLGTLIGVCENTDMDALLSEVEDVFKGCDVKVKMSHVNDDSYQHWVNMRGLPKHVITLLGRRISAKTLARVTDLLSKEGLDIYHITRLTGRVPLEDINNASQSCMEFIARGEVESVADLRKALMKLANELSVDLAYQEDSVYRRNRRLVAFDMDSTLIQQEVIDELAKEAGVGEQVSAITAAAMRGELDFKASLKARVSQLKGLPESTLQKVAKNLTFSEGTVKLLNTLNQLGFKTAILSGGFTYFGRYLAQQLDIDYVYSNELEIIDGVLTGEVIGEIVDGERKASLLKEIAEKEALDLQQVIAVGDGANDLPMLGIAGLGIAFHAKPLVQASAKNSVSTLGLDALLYFMGLADKDLNEAIN